MKTAEELTALKNEVEVLNQKLSALTEEELAQISGGNGTWNPIEDQTVPVKDGDYCPRCRSGFIVTVQYRNSRKICTAS